MPIGSNDPDEYTTAFSLKYDGDKQYSKKVKDQ